MIIEEIKWYDKNAQEHSLEVNDPSELEEAVEQEMDEYCEELHKEEGMTRPVNEDDPVGDMDAEQIKISFMWTNKAVKMIENEMNQWTSIAAKYYPDEGIEVRTNWYKEY